MNEIESNKHAWGKLSEDHYKVFKEALSQGTLTHNPHIIKELGDLSGKSIIHLQCNTGADTIMLAKDCKNAVGVDLVPDNIRYARRLAWELNVKNVKFIESNVLDFMGKHNEKYDVVFVSEGAIGWLPELESWGKTIRHLLKDDGFFYILDSHPFYLSMSEEKLGQGILEIKYPYFGGQPAVEYTIGGYASEPKDGVESYFWLHPVSTIMGSLVDAGLHIEYFHEFPENFFDSGGLEKLENGLYDYPWNKDKLAQSFSIRASVYHQ